MLTGEVVSAQTVSKLSRNLDRLVKAFQQAPLADEWAYLFLDGVSLRVRRPEGRKRAQMLVAYGVRADGSRRLLAFLRSQGEIPAAGNSGPAPAVSSHRGHPKTSPSGPAQNVGTAP
jgi:transposase-like protein